VSVRPFLHRLVSLIRPGVAVLSRADLVEGTPVRVMGRVGWPSERPLEPGPGDEAAS
jgi:flagellar biosynthesis component FlhA